METTGKRTFVKRSLLRDEIRDAIQQAIISKELKPGDRIVETQWAKELGVSKAPVREAIRELEAIGLLENKPFQGSYVRMLTAKEINDAYQVRMVLESMGMEEAAKRITQNELDELRTLLEEMETAAQNSEFELYIQKNYEFHQRIIEFADNKMLLAAWRQSNIQEWISIVTQMSKRSLENLAIRHENMYNALANHDVEGSRQSVIAHLTELVEEIRLD